VLIPGPVTCASRGMEITLTGRSAHASQPETGTSPMAALARLMPGLTALSHGTTADTDFTLATVTHARMGPPAFGIAPGEAVLHATLRTLTDDRMAALVGVIMGSQSDWETRSHACGTLEALGVAHESRVVSAHRTPDLLFEYASTARDRGLKVVIAGAGGAAHLPGMVASKTALPVLGVPVQSKALSGMDSLLSIAQMPGGVPVGTLAIGKAGAINAALLAAGILALGDPAIAEALDRFRAEQTERVLKNPDPGA